MKAEFLSADQDWTVGATTYWFSITGVDYGTGYEFDENMYGVVESGIHSHVVDENGYPLTDGDVETIAVKNSINITDEIRSAT